MIGLLLAFAVSLSVFTATYDQQAKVDAQLTLGADVTVSSPPGVAGSSDLASKVASVPGVAATTAVNHSYAYVGPDLQDTYGIDPAHFRNATSLRDSYFLGGSADQMMSRLASTPDGILVSLETITDYSLHPGDLLRLRVLDQSTGRFRVAPFHVVGTVQEFPSAPRDSFMVTNQGYLDQLTHSGPNVVFAKTSESPPAVASPHRRGHGLARHGGEEHRPADRPDGHLDHDRRPDRDQPSRGGLRDRAGGRRDRRVRARRRGRAPPRVRHDDRDRRLPAGGGGLRLERGGDGADRGRRLAAGLGWLLARMLVAMLTHVFDPPPDHLAIPWGFLGLLYARRAPGRDRRFDRRPAGHRPPAARPNPAGALRNRRDT